MLLPTRKTDGTTPLSNAAEHGNEAVVRLLLQREDVDAESKDIRGAPPLEKARRKGHENGVHLLLDHKK